MTAKTSPLKILESEADDICKSNQSALGNQLQLQARSQSEYASLSIGQDRSTVLCIAEDAMEAMDTTGKV